MNIFTTKRLDFREFTKADIDKLYLLLSDAVIMKYCLGAIDMEMAQWCNEGL